VLSGVHDAIRSDGWAVARRGGHERFVSLYERYLEPDPRGPGKMHARDVVAHDLTGVTECGSIAFRNADGTVTDDYSRMPLLTWADDMVRGLLELIPPEMRPTRGRVSADYFRYSSGPGAGAHQDRFGDMVIIYVLARTGTGAESFLTGLGGADVFRRVLEPGEVLVFRDELFLHGVTALDGRRDVLILITLK
jgi:hypothetical protein